MFEPLNDLELGALRRLTMTYHLDNDRVLWHTADELFAMSVRSKRAIPALTRRGYLQVRGADRAQEVRLNPSRLGSTFIQSAGGLLAGRGPRDSWLTGLLRGHLSRGTATLLQHDPVGALALALCLVEPARPALQVWPLAEQLSERLDPRAAVTLLRTLEAELHQLEQAVAVLAGLS